MGLVFTQVGADNGYRADEQPLNPAVWTVSSGYPSPQVDAAIVSNRIVAGVPDLAGVEFFTQKPVSNDQFVAITIDEFQYNGESAIAAYVRAAVDYSSFYYAGPFQKKLELDVVIGGVETSLGTVDIPAVNQGDVLELSIVGSLISVSYNGVVMIAVENSAIASGLPGFEVGSDAAQNDTAISLIVVGNAKLPADHSSVGD